MTRRLTLTGILLATLTMPAMAERHGGRGEGRDPSPEAITARSIHRVQRVTRRSVRIMRRQAHHCALAITQLLENEDPDGTAEVAEGCIGRINQVAQRGSEIVGRIAERAITALTELEAPEEMTEAVQNAVQRSLEIIQGNRAATIQVVEDALAGSPPE